MAFVVLESVVCVCYVDCLTAEVDVFACEYVACLDVDVFTCIDIYCAVDAAYCAACGYTGCAVEFVFLFACADGKAQTAAEEQTTGFFLAVVDAGVFVLGGVDVDIACGV